MINKDFETGGFPVNKTAPIICVDKDYTLYVTWNRCKFKQILDTKNIVKCVGIWPGKFNTDVYPLSVPLYKEQMSLLRPPSDHEDIDNAQNIIIEYKKGKFTGLSYVSNDGLTFNSNDEKLHEYIKSTGLPHEVRELSSPPLKQDRSGKLV